MDSRYIVVFEDLHFKSRHWTPYESKEIFENQYQKSWGRIIAQGITRYAAMRLCGANEEMVRELELTEMKNQSPQTSS
ncbi:MAG TPA: hypothetical protein VLH94_04050 [Spirochaetia bacterium]|nr:hypothetical protein [Spirochaetia bacterium]